MQNLGGIVSKYCGEVMFDYRSAETHLKVRRVQFHLWQALQPPSQPPPAPSLRGSEILWWLRRDEGGLNMENVTDFSFWLTLKPGCKDVCQGSRGNVGGGLCQHLFMQKKTMLGLLLSTTSFWVQNAKYKAFI